MKSIAKSLTIILVLVITCTCQKEENKENTDFYYADNTTANEAIRAGQLQSY